MNVKKFLKEKAQEDLQSVRTDRDQETLQRLKNSVVEEPPKPKRNMKWLWAIPSGVLACVITAVLIVELVPSQDNNLGDIPGDVSGDVPSDVRYDEVNFVQETSDISELSGALTHLTLNFTANQVVDITKTSDSLSGDELYYTLNIEENSMDAIYNFQLMIVVNDNYDYSGFEINDGFETETYSDFSVIYRQQIVGDSDSGVNLVQCRAKIESEKYEIYVLKYEEYSLENGMFLTIINNILDFSE